MFTREIRTEGELFTWLVAYMQRGRKRCYPKPIVEFADLLIHKMPSGLDMQNLIDIGLGFEGPSQPNGLAALFWELARDTSPCECSELIITFAAEVYEHLCHTDEVDLGSANRLAIHCLRLGLSPLKSRASKRYFKQVSDQDGKWLVGTGRLAREHGLAVRLSFIPTEERS
ncbi:hypothetical protein [Microvirga yunnanensis]|uniref:hypothetical protein n=1 Tax=Microvirga yunnanensis TaxID=2953740 RepID=UPI0021C7F349|nr:hypothetical protein [Microvirga sp. HBU65207]